MAGETVTKNTTFLTSAYIWQRLLSFVYFVLVARFIGVENLGKYTFAISFVTLFSVLIELGLNQALIRESAKFKDKSTNYLSSILGVKVIATIIVYALVVVTINLLHYPALTKMLVYLAGIQMIFDQFANTFWGVFRGAENLKWESASVAINQVIILVVGLVVLFLRLSLGWLMLPFIAASLFSCLFAAISVRKVLKIKYSISFDWPTIAFLFKLAVFFALISIFSRVYGYIDTVMLSKLAGDVAVGLYSVAMKIPFALQFIPLALSAAIFPAFSRHFIHDQRQLKLTFDRVMKFLVIIVIPISVGVAVLARPIILFFYGVEYLPAVLPLQILMLGLVFVFLNFPLGSLLNGCDRQGINTVLVGSTMAFNIALNIFLIPRYSFVGASVAFLCSHACLFFASLIVARRIIPYSKVNLIIIGFKTLFSALVMGATIYFLIPRIQFIILIIGGGLIYFLVMYLIRGYTVQDIKYFQQVLLKRPAAPEGGDPA